MVEQAVIWTVIDIAGSPVGQAATFSSWKHARDRDEPFPPTDPIGMKSAS
jgi:MEKHLA domain.